MLNLGSFGEVNTCFVRCASFGGLVTSTHSSVSGRDREVRAGLKLGQNVTKWYILLSETSKGLFIISGEPRCTDHWSYLVPVLFYNSVPLWPNLTPKCWEGSMLKVTPEERRTMLTMFDIRSSCAQCCHSLEVNTDRAVRFGLKWSKMALNGTNSWPFKICFPYILILWW